MAEDVREPAARLGRRGDPVARPSPRLGKRRELHDGAPQRPVADLGPRGIGPGLHDDVAPRTRRLEELADEARLADADVADDARARQRAGLAATRFEPGEVVLAAR